jgi:hypothetical protein
VHTRRLLTALGALAVAGTAISHVRLHNPSNGAALFWQSPGAISIVLNAQGSDDIAAGGHFPALRMAIDAWNDVAGTSALLVEDTSSASQARTDWDSNSVHLVYFDENDSSGYFPSGSSTVAITPVSFYSNGRIADADVLFNGEGFAFTTSAELGAFDVADVAAHELGHLLGLDHTGSAGATMYPYVSPLVREHRSVSGDDAAGLRAAYPSGTHASIHGVVRRASDSSTVAGAYVVARDADGRSVAGALADADGDFVVSGLAAGDYSLVAVPLDSPVSSQNLSQGHTIVTDFQPIVGARVVVAAGASVDYGDLLVGNDVALTLGRNFDDFPLRAQSGATTPMTLHGIAMGVGAFLSASDARITISSVTFLGSTLVDFDVTVPVGAEPGHVDLLLDNGQLAVLAGALEITPPDPTVSAVTPPAGDPAGGVLLQIDGSDFRAGARVVIGDQLYEDGDGSCTVVDDSTITLVTSATNEVGVFDVVVIDATGVEGRASSAFSLSGVPALTHVFPGAGADVGGTEITLTGSGFSAPMQVRIDGVVQSGVEVQDSSTMRFVTLPGTAGGALVLEVEDADGDIAAAAFTYVVDADPSIASIAPDEGPTGGGTSVTIHGANFAAGASVIFGADPDTGLGGKPAGNVVVVDANTITARAPSHSAGAVAVVVRAPSTAQASALPAAFSYRANDDGGGGGGGGCGFGGSTMIDTSWRSIVSGAGWIPLLVAWLWVARRRPAWAMARGPSSR